MAKSSIWLRETGRLYLRYTAVGLIGIPLALLYAWARRADWSLSVVSPILLLLGFVSAFMMWRWLGDWRIPSAEVAVATADAASAAWADLINAARRTTVTHQQVALCLQQSVRANEEQAWNLLLTSAHAAGSTRLSYSVEVADAVLKNRLPQQEQENYSQPTKVEPTQQRQPAWALALGGQTQSAQGLA